MKRSLIGFLIIINVLFLSSFSGAASESPRKFVEDLLITQGLDPLQAQSIMQDSRLSIRPDIVMKNLFYSSPKGTVQRPDVMDVNPLQIKQGRAFMTQNAGILSTVEKRFGASPRIITAILIIESRLGTYPMPYNVVTAYANLAFMLDPDHLKYVQDNYGDAYPQLYDEDTIDRVQRKAKWAVDELYHLANIANQLAIDPISISGSFAGAMGPGQFIPSSFWMFGLDGDGDGIADPFNMADANLSMGYYLKNFGWREDAPVEQKRKAIWHYNRSEVYVNTVMMVYEKLLSTHKKRKRLKVRNDGS